MMVSHLNTFPYGGAATAALRLHHQMRHHGCSSQFLYEKDDRTPGDESSVQLQSMDWESPRTQNPFGRFMEKRRTRKIYRLYDRHLAGRDESLEVFSMPSIAGARRWNMPSCDVLHLHWIAFMADYPSFFGALPKHLPIVWTLHDMNPLTGGCHYSGGCSRYQSGCGNCPQVFQPKPQDVSYHGFRTKRAALSSKNLTIVSPSQWLQQLALDSGVFPPTATFHHIRLGFDLQQLRPLSKLESRRKLGIDSQAVIVGFGAESVNNHRKGLDLLLAALDGLNGKVNIECLVFGAGEIDRPELNLPKMHSLGYLKDPSQLTEFYSACDLVVVPSREDNQPQVGLEALACGTPVVGFDIGGIGEYVRPGQTGWLAEGENAVDLARQMKRLIDDQGARIRFGHQGRALMEAEFDIVKQAQKYLDLYQTLVPQHKWSSERPALTA